MSEKKKTAIVFSSTKTIYHHSKHSILKDCAILNYVASNHIMNSIMNLPSISFTFYNWASPPLYALAFVNEVIVKLIKKFQGENLN